MTEVVLLIRNDLDTQCFTTALQRKEMPALMSADSLLQGRQSIFKLLFTLARVKGRA